MKKGYSVENLREIGLDDEQIKFVMSQREKVIGTDNVKVNEDIGIPTSNAGDLMHIQHEVEVNTSEPLVPTSLAQIASYKNGTIVPLPPFADGQPFIARMVRPSMLALVKNGKIPNSLLNQATSLFANGAGALGASGKNSANVSELFDVIDVIVDAALLEPTLAEIRSVGMDLSDDQLLAIFSYTQKGVKALEQFRTK